MYMKTFRFCLLLVFGSWLLQACADKTEETPSIDDDKEDRYGLIKIAENDYTPEVCTYMLQDDEPESVMFDRSRRSFKVNLPLQVSINDEQELFIRFFSPRSIRSLVIWAKINGYEEEFKLAEFEILPPFVEFHKRLPFVDTDKRYITRSGKEIEILANPHFQQSELSLQIACKDPYYEKVTASKCKYTISFSSYGNTGSWKYSLKPAHAREAVAMSLNMAYMFSSDEFVGELDKYRGKLHSDNNKTVIDVDQLCKRVQNHSGLMFGHVSGVDGLGGGNTFGLSEWSFLEHYADDGCHTHAAFHELGHCLGYGHNGNMTYEQTGPGWITLCGELYTRLSKEKKLPVYSRRFMHTRKYGKLYGSARYQASRYIIEDPELDALDGGLAPVLDGDDENTEEGTPLSCTISYADIPGATEKTFTPKDICVNGDRIYIVNDATGNYCLEIFDVKEGKIIHLKSLKAWMAGDKAETFTALPTGVTVAHDKIYVTRTDSRTEIFNAKTFELITCIGTGQWGEGAYQTVHAFDVLVRRGCVFIRDKRKVCIFMEKDVQPGTYQKISNYCRTQNLGEAMGTYGLAMDKDGLLYTTHQGNKKIHIFDCNAIREQNEWKEKSSITLPSPVFDIALIGKRMIVALSPNKTQPVGLAEISLQSGEIIKDYTKVGKSGFQSPEKLMVSRQTLFVVDRKTMTVTGIPVSELN